MHHWKIPTGLALLAVALAGCGGDTTAKSTEKPASGAKTTSTEGAKPDNPSPTVAKADKADHDHSGWWCPEHGIPEEECSMCSDTVAKEMKAKGDWCEKHERAMSQCFTCKPERREFYAAKHRAKYNKEPPPTDDPKEDKKEATKG